MSLVIVSLVVGMLMVGSVASVSADEGPKQEGLQSPYVLPMKAISECLGCVAQPIPVEFGGVHLHFAFPFVGIYSTAVNFGGFHGTFIKMTAPQHVNAFGKTLVFKHWRSVTDNQVLTTNQTLAGYINKSEILAAVYQAQPNVALKIDVKGECENCSFNVGIAGLSVGIGTSQGPRTTPTQLTVNQGGQIILMAQPYVMVQNRLLQFRAWRSVTDNKVLGFGTTLSGFADKHETLAVVYREVPYFFGWENAQLDQ